MRPWHLTLKSRGRHPLFPGEALLRRAVRRIVEICGPWLVLFCVVDEHAHVIVYCDRHRCGVLARALQRSLRGLAVVDTQPMYTGEIHGRNHMENTRGYVLDQPAHHDLPVHSALWSGGCFLDLVGARDIPGLDLRIRDALPRFHLHEAFRDVGLPPRTLVPTPDTQLRALGPSALVEAAAMACAADPQLRGTSRPCIRARRTACVLAKQANVPLRELGWALDIDPQSARRLARSAPDEAAMAAARRFLRLKELVAEQIRLEAAKRRG